MSTPDVYETTKYDVSNTAEIAVNINENLLVIFSVLNTLTGATDINAECKESYLDMVGKGSRVDSGKFLAYLQSKAKIIANIPDLLEELRLSNQATADAKARENALKASLTTLQEDLNAKDRTIAQLTADLEAAKKKKEIGCFYLANLKDASNVPTTFNGLKLDEIMSDAHTAGRIALYNARNSTSFDISTIDRVRKSGVDMAVRDLLTPGVQK